MTKPMIQPLNSLYLPSVSGSGYAYQSPDHVFWGDHPFGQYRWRLAEDLRGYGPLLKKLGVSDTHNHEDALAVLHDISSQFGEANSPLDDETHAVVMNCWQMLEEALNEGTIVEDWLGELGETKNIPNKDEVLYFPTRLFFENRAGLAAKFQILESHMIPRQLGTERAFLAAGVQPLGSAREHRASTNWKSVRRPRYHGKIAPASQRNRSGGFPVK